MSYYRIIQTQNAVFEVFEFCKWYCERQLKPFWILVERRDSRNPKSYLTDWKFFRVYNRFDKKYVRKQILKFKIRLEPLSNKSFVHIVLTSNRNYTISESKTLLKKSWNKLNTLLKKKIGDFDFVTVLEPQQDGYPHLHILIFTNKFVIEKDHLTRLCEKYKIGKINFIKRYWSYEPKKPLFYLIKYLSKQYKTTSWTIGQLIFYANIWFYSKKTKIYTFNFRSKFPIKKEKIWKLVKVGPFELIWRKIQAKLKLKLYVWELTFEKLDDFLIF